MTEDKQEILVCPYCNNQADFTKVPFLGDIPIIGNLFKTTNKQEDKTELLIFITPRIIKDQLTIR